MHVNKPTLHSSILFDNILQTFGLAQHVNFLTHIRENTLDLFITRKTFPFLKSVIVSDKFSDHFAVIMNLSLPTPPPQKRKTTTFRRTGSIDHDLFREDLLAADFIRNPATCSTSLCHQFDVGMREIMDTHAPLVTRSISERDPNPWISSEFLEAKRRRRVLEKAWRRSRSALDRSRLTKQAHLCNKLISKAKNNYYSSMVSENLKNPKKIWSAINRILHRFSKSPLPDHSSLTELSNTFGQFFKDKIDVVRTSFNPSDAADSIFPQIKPPILNSFTDATEDEVTKIIDSSSTTSCNLDTVPTTLLKRHLDIPITPITQIINFSMQSGQFPKCFKTAHVKPLLKKPKLSKNDLKNYRLVSNLKLYIQNSRESRSTSNQ